MTGADWLVAGCYSLVVLIAVTDALPARKRKKPVRRRATKKRER